MSENDAASREPSEESPVEVDAPPAPLDKDESSNPTGETDADSVAIPGENDVEESPAEGSDKSKLKIGLPKWAKPVLIGILVVIAVSVCYVTFYHDWEPATCTSPQICKICGKEQGEPLGHDWAEATCTKPKTCKVCGVTSGSPLGHEVKDDAWVIDTPSTCTEKGSKHGICSRCGETITDEVPVVDHTEGDWEITKEATVDSSGNPVPGTRSIKCTVCGKVLKTEEYSLSPEEVANQFKSACESPSYEDVARDPDNWEGHKVAFTGKVIQVMQDGNSYTLRVNVTKGSYGIWSDTILVSYKAGAGDSRILEDDVMTFYGTMNGMYSYKSVLGATVTVPLLVATYTG